MLGIASCSTRMHNNRQRVARIGEFLGGVGDTGDLLSAGARAPGSLPGKAASDSLPVAPSRGANVGSPGGNLLGTGGISTQATTKYVAREAEQNKDVFIVGLTNPRSVLNDSRLERHGGGVIRGEQ